MDIRMCTLLAMLMGCSGNPVGANNDSGVPDSASPQSSLDNPCQAGNLGAGITCDHYCTTFMSACRATISGVYDDIANCKSKCASFSQDQICCRGYHADLAATTPSPSAVTLHCPHAAGQSVCP
jgi:hypothetical protein